MNIKEILRAIPPLYDHSDKKIRDEATNLIIGIYNYIGIEPLNPTLEVIRPLQKKDIEDKIATQDTKSVPKRFFRSLIIVGGGVPEIDEAKEPDPFDFIDEKDILAQLNKEFYSQLISSDWKQRKEAVDYLGTLANYPKIKPGDYSNLFSTIARIIANDKNIMVIQKACEAVGYFANGLRQEFSTIARHLFPVLLSKFKEKKLTANIHPPLEIMFKV